MKVIAELQELAKRSPYSGLSFGLESDEACLVSDENRDLESQLKVTFPIFTAFFE